MQNLFTIAIFKKRVKNILRFKHLVLLFVVAIASVLLGAKEGCRIGTFQCPTRSPIAWNENIPTVISPRRSLALSDRPLIEWLNVGGPYRVWITCNGSISWYEEGIEENQFRSPIGLSGKCRAIVANESGSSLDENPPLGGVGFIVPPAREREKACSNETGLDRVRCLHEEGYHAAAVKEIEELPPSPTSDAIAAKIWAYYILVPPNALKYANRALEDLPERSLQAEEMREVIEWAGGVLPRAAN